MNQIILDLKMINSLKSINKQQLCRITVFLKLFTVIFFKSVSK